MDINFIIALCSEIFGLAIVIHTTIDAKNDKKCFALGFICMIILILSIAFTVTRQYS